MAGGTYFYGPVIFKVAMFVNLISVLFNVMNDCDETYNYWEPLHFVVTRGHGGGFQTWEYSPAYGLRSYLYLWLIGWPAFLVAQLGWPMWIGFLLVRFHLAVWSAAALTYLAVVLANLVSANTNKAFGLPLGIWFCAFYALSPGNFISSTTFLPSGPATTLCLLMIGFWLSGNWFWSVGCVAITGIIIWPFAALLGFPLALYLLTTHRLVPFLTYASTWAMILIPITLIVDTYHFGRLVLAPWNIIHYNLFPHTLNLSGSASQLYGVEPASFYLKNYILNHNLAFALAGLFLLLVTGQLLLRILCKSSTSKTPASDSSPFSLHLSLVCVSPMLLWNLIFFLQQHKEERFLFPAYPCLSLAAALFTYWCVQRLARLTRWVQVNQLLSATLSLGIIIVFLLASMSRISGVIRWYNAPVYLIRHLPTPSPTSKPLLCLGRDWHYFPSRFLLPGNGDRWTVSYLQSNFTGQLPGQFSAVRTPKPDWLDSTRSDGNRFNRNNQEELDRYVLGGSKSCDFILDRDSKPGPREELYVADTKNWQSIAARSILEPHSCRISFQTDPWHSWLQRYPFLCHVFRSFYIPYVSEQTNQPVRMHILMRRNLTIHAI